MGRRRRRNSMTLTYQRREKKFKIGMLYEALKWIIGIVISVFLAFMVVYMFGTKTAVAGSSMEPNLSNAQEVLINKVAYQFSAPKRGDVIAFRPNGNEKAHISIKRVIGVPGDSIRIVSGKVFLNGIAFDKDWAIDTKDAGVAAEEIQLGADEYFVMGDNRQNSEDSRSANIGNVSRTMIEGKVWYHLKSDKDGNGKVE